jgi:benzoyl-CoA reductase/2-hydroxyglutaryl-CoA dehydratase subunit BcrC/BadD/HgdB
MFTEAEALAKEENRTMSELVREALRAYKREREAWGQLMRYGQSRPRAVRTEEQAVGAVREVRQARRGRESGTK